MVASPQGIPDGNKMRAALALAVLLGEVSESKVKSIRKIINAETD